MYKYTDKITAYLNRIFVRQFKKLSRSILDFDNINAIEKSVNACYKTCFKETRYRYLDIAKHAYKKADGDDTAIDIMWIDGFLNEYDPVTKYVFTREFDRKRARAFESIVATKDKKEVDTALKYLARQVKQWADNVTDEATLQAYKDNGVKRVRWNTEKDSRVCAICGERNNEIYDIDKIPDKPHPGCRCWLTPVK